MEMNAADAERLELLELEVSNEESDLESLLEKQFGITLDIMFCRERLRQKSQARDSFKSAMQGMKDGRYV